MWEDEKVSQSVARPLTGRGEEKWLSAGFRQADGESPEDSFGSG